MASPNSAKPTIASLQFDASGWIYHGEREPGRMRLWETPDHDAVVLHFFALAPDLPVVRSAAELRGYYEAQMGASSATKLVECDIIKLAGCKTIRLLLKAPQKPSGMFYQGALTAPFRDFSFVIKVQCSETGTTGVREAIFFDKRLKSGEQPNTSGKGPIFPNWNPDAPAHDADFPTHPVSRARRLLERVAITGTLDPIVRAAPAFALP